MNIQKFSAIMNLANSIHMHLGYVGYAVVGDRWHTQALATPFNRLYLIEKGTGELSTEKETLRLEPGNAYLLPADLPCSYHCDGELSLLFFHFNLVDDSQFDLMRHVEHLAVIRYPLAQLTDLHRVCEEVDYTNAFEVICGVNDILRQMHRQYQFRWDHTPVHSLCVTKAMSRINAGLSAQLRIDQLAQDCFVSRSYLARQFKKELGLTIKQYILLQLINTAQWQLSHTDIPVERISRELGFCNQFYFSECFKKHCRVSPLQYRNGTKY